jgi:YVTN family beta-propeller protein
MTDRSVRAASPPRPRNEVPGRRKHRWATPAFAGLLVAIGTMIPAASATAQDATGSAPAGDTPAGKYTTTAYVVSSETGTVTPIDTENGTAESPIAVGHGANAMAVAPNGRTGYVTVSAGVVPIDLLSNIPGQLIPLPGGPRSIAITPDSKAALVGTLDGRLYRISLSSATVATPVTLPAKAVNIAITPDGRTAYMVTNVHAHELRVIVYNIATNTVLSSIQEPDGAMALAVAPNGTTAYVANFLSKVTPLSTATNALGPPINDVGRSGSLYKAIAITPDGQKLYVVDSSGRSVIPIDTSTNKPGKPIPVGLNPRDVAVTWDGTTALVVNSGDATVTPINTATEQPGTPVKVPAGPVAVATLPGKILLGNVPCGNLAALTQDLSTIASGPSVVGGRISLAPNCTYSLQAPQAFPTLSVPVAIVGHNTKLAFKGEYTNAMVVTKQGDVTLKDLTISGGDSETGGAAENSGRLTLNDVVLSKNRSFNAGGALANEGGGTLVVTDSRLEQNRAGAGGGAISSLNGNLFLTRTSITGNGAQAAGGVLVQGGMVSLTDTTIKDNNATDRDSGVEGVYLSDAHVTIKNSTIADCHWSGKGPTPDGCTH